MKSINNFVVEFDQAYIDELSYGNLSLKLATNIDNVDEINRCGVLRAVPIDYEGNAKVGNRVIVHHNITRQTLNYQEHKNNEFKISRNLYRVPLDLLFLYEENERWHSHGEWCFVKPLEAEIIEKTESGIYIPKSAQPKYQALKGVMWFTNDFLPIKKGEDVLYRKWSEHKFMIDGELLYKMSVDRVLAKWLDSDSPNIADKLELMPSYYAD